MAAAAASWPGPTAMTARREACPDGKGGAGETIGGTACEPCTGGRPGATGQAGSGGKGAGAIAADGYTGSLGAGGDPGKVGQGGGGGGGSKGAGGITCGNMTNLSVTGASGGSGGAGGCGGNGGNGGKAGGSSIALIVLGATVTFEKVSMEVGQGGKGGKGGYGQPGGIGGIGHLGGTGAQGTPNAAKKGCTGGDGGTGGTGGPGGGGQGGHAIGVAHTGAPPNLAGVMFNLPGAPRPPPAGCWRLAQRGSRQGRGRAHPARADLLIPAPATAHRKSTHPAPASLKHRPWTPHSSTPKPTACASPTSKRARARSCSLLHGFPDTAHTWDRPARPRRSRLPRRHAVHARLRPTADPDEEAFDSDTLGRDALA